MISFKSYFCMQAIDERYKNELQIDEMIENDILPERKCSILALWKGDCWLLMVDRHATSHHVRSIRVFNLIQFAAVYLLCNGLYIHTDNNNGYIRCAVRVNKGKIIRKLLSSVNSQRRECISKIRTYLFFRSTSSSFGFLFRIQHMHGTRNTMPGFLTFFSHSPLCLSLSSSVHWVSMCALCV